MTDYNFETVGDRDRAFAKLSGEVAALRQLVKAMLAQLPDLTIEIALERLKEHVRETEARARQTDNDLWRDHAASLYDIAGKIIDDTEAHMAERAEGARLTTVQAAPIDPEDLRLRALGREPGNRD